MLHTLAISGYRSLKDIVLSLGQLNLITGPNGSGKSSIYRALRLLGATSAGRLIQHLAQEGGLESTLWAGPESLGASQGSVRKKPIRLCLGFSSEDFSYTIDLGLPSSETPFDRDPVIKRECLWRGLSRRARDLCVDRRGQHIRCRPDRAWEDVHIPLSNYTSMLTEFGDPERAPELILLRDTIRNWRFYDHIRTDSEAPARRMQVASYTPVMAGDGSDLAAALMTIQSIGDSQGLDEVIDDAFPGSSLTFDRLDARLEVGLRQDGMLRPLRSTELSDGTLRYLLWSAALMTPRPPELMVLNEPETSLHPDLLPALGRLIARYAEKNQVFVVTHAPALIESLSKLNQCVHVQLEKSFGATQLLDVDPFDIPNWDWPPR